MQMKNLPPVDFTRFIIDVHRSVNPGEFCFLPVTLAEDGTPGIIPTLAYFGPKPPTDKPYVIVGYIYEGYPAGLDLWESRNAEWLNQLNFKNENAN